MIRGELDVLKDWCYEAVSLIVTDRFATDGTFCHLGSVFTQTIIYG